MILEPFWQRSRCVLRPIGDAKRHGDQRRARSASLTAPSCRSSWSRCCCSNFCASYHIHQRTRDPQVAEAVLRGARITRKTLARYACHQPPELRAGGDLHSAGPRRLDLFAAICLAMGENPGRALWAATVGGDYPSMLALLHAEVHLRPRLLISDPVAGPDSAQLEVVPLRRAGA